MRPIDKKRHNATIIDRARGGVLRLRPTEGKKQGSPDDLVKPESRKSVL